MNQIANNKQENLILTEQETLEQVVNCLNKNVSTNSTNKFDTNSLFQIIENSCKELTQATCENNIRYHLKKIHDLGKLEKEIGSTEIVMILYNIIQSRLFIGYEITFS